MNDQPRTDGKRPVPPAQIKVGAHVLIQLGRELVTDAEQALLECVKNAYDADAPGCRIEVDTRAVTTRVERDLAERLGRFGEGSSTVEVAIKEVQAPLDDEGVPLKGEFCERTLTCRGSMVIEDKGDGMTADQLRSSWLVVSGSAKRGSTGQPKVKTGKGRTPLGDKGLGRLGTMKLGDVLLVETAPSPDSDLATAQFRWADCGKAATVDEIPVSFGSVPNVSRFKGTRVSVLGLNDLQEWTRDNRVEGVATSLAKLVSPFEAVSTFPVTVSIDDSERSLVSVTNDVLSRAVAKFTFDWMPAGSGELRLVARAFMSRRLLAPQRSATQKARYDRVFGKDGGAGFAAMLMSPKRLKGYSHKSIGEERDWYVRLDRAYPWSDLLLKDGTAIVNPGPFTGEFYFFHLNKIDEADSGAAITGSAVTSEIIKGMAGVAILRDGFRVRSQGDWLGLSSEMTSGSTYGLRADNTIGYFALTGEHNHQLVEKSDREGFVEDAAYRGFLQVAKRCRAFATDSLEIVRRSLDQYAKAVEMEGHEELARPGAPIKAVERSMRTAQEARQVAERSVEEIDEVIGALQREVGGTAGTDRSITRAVEVARTARDAMDVVRGKLTDSVRPDDALRFLRREIDNRQEQVVALYESAAVGLSARGLAHELRTHLDEIGQRTVAVQKAAKAAGNEPVVLPHLRHIRSSCGAISNAASLIDPMLPRSRTIRETFRVASFVADYLENRAVSMAHAGIATRLEAAPPSAVVRANRPRMLQVLDNLVQNSVYWLKRGAVTGEATGPKEIRIDVSETGFVLSDTGPGVDPHVEDRLFDIFVSARPDGEGGQGIGLFIVTQLLALDGCTISLLPDLNSLGRQHRFLVDLSRLLVTP